MTGGAPLRIGLVGLTGRMGREISALAEGDPGLVIAGGVGSKTVADLPAVAAASDVLVDFSTPDATVAVIDAGGRAGVPLVLGTTGLTGEQVGQVRALSERVPVWYARNMSTGVSLLQRVLPEVARALGEYDIEVIEAHHRHKVDAPSGTALMLAEAILAGLADPEAHPAVYGREGYSPRQPDEIGFHSIRGGGNPGEHTLVFASDEEEIRISHRAFSRQAFAAGAIRAARAIHGRPPGWYGPE